MKDQFVCEGYGLLLDRRDIWNKYERVGKRKEVKRRVRGCCLMSHLFWWRMM